MENNKRSSAILPGNTIGIIGGGQLGRMMAISARYMGYKIVVLDPTPNCPTAQVADQQIIAAYDDLTAIKELTELSDAVTYEFENVDLKAAQYIEAKGKLPQGAYALEVTQNRRREKELVERAGLPVSPFEIINHPSEVEEILKDFSLPAVIKTCTGGYDGKGQLKINSLNDLDRAKAFVKDQNSYIIEQWVSFDREISVIFTRAIDGDIKFFPIAENEHKEQILSKTIVPASITKTVEEKAYKAARILADQIDVVGTFAIEMFVKGEEIFINEMAPRPHNSGHYTIEACNVSQFTQHVYAICGRKLKDITLFQPALMENILGKDLPTINRLIETDHKRSIHLYGKEEAKPARKMGHMTFIAPKKEELDPYL